jgi:ABC-type antimicrobial peptide transport system permease subunit
MALPFGLYPNFYVRRKDLLFPLIEKYGEIRITPATKHSEAMQAYLYLLRNNAAVKAEVDNLIHAQANKIITNKQRQELRLQAGEKKEYSNAAGWVDTVVDIAGSIFGGSGDSKTAQAEADKAFYETIMAQQKANSTAKILIVSVLTLAVVGAGLYLYYKSSK